MSASKPPRPVATLVRDETSDERLTLLATQVDHRMHIAEAMAGLLLALASAIRDEETKNPELEKMPAAVSAASVRLGDVVQGERR